MVSELLSSVSSVFGGVSASWAIIVAATVFYFIVKHNERIRGWAHNIIGTGTIGKPLAWFFLYLTYLILQTIVFLIIIRNTGI